MLLPKARLALLYHSQKASPYRVQGCLETFSWERVSGVQTPAMFSAKPPRRFCRICAPCLTFWSFSPQPPPEMRRVEHGVSPVSLHLWSGVRSLSSRPAFVLQGVLPAWGLCPPPMPASAETTFLTLPARQATIESVLAHCSMSSNARVRTVVCASQGPFDATVWAQGAQRPSPPTLSSWERERGVARVGTAQFLLSFRTDMIPGASAKRMNSKRV
jgi:hypothetical protein